MRESRLCVDATVGTTVSVGDGVEAGQQVGVTPEGNPVRSLGRGVVRAVTFESEHHRFVIIIEPRSIITDEDGKHTKRRAT